MFIMQKTNSLHFGAFVSLAVYHNLTHSHTNTHRLTQFSIMLLDMSLMRLSRCLANSSSGQCRSLMKVWRASSFQKRSSDVPEPLLPLTQTHIHRSEDKCQPVTWGGGGIKGLEGVGVVVAGAEVDAVPLHFFFFTQFCSGHILTGPPTCLLSCLFRSFWTVSLWVKKEREGFTVTDQ